MKEPDLNEAINELGGVEVNILRETADRLFSDKPIRFSFTESEGDAGTCMKIVIDEKLTLFFFKKDGGWDYDGWEMGDYQDYWTKGAL